MVNNNAASENRKKTTVITTAKSTGISFEETQDEKFLIKLPSGETLPTHFDHPFPPMERELAQLLVDDILIHPRNAELGEYRDSLVYCMLSTMIETPRGTSCGDPYCKRDHYNHTIDIGELIQWDRAFRLDPDPHLMMAEMKVVRPVKDFIGEDYRNLQLNYRTSIEEMEIEDGFEPGFVSGEIIKKFSDILSGFTRAQRFSVELVSELFENFSISLSIMLINKQITPEQYFRAALCFLELKETERLSSGQKERCRLFEKRIGNLLAALGSEAIKEFL